MDAGYILISSLVFSAKASSVYAVYWFAQFLPARSKRGYIPWGAPVSLGEKLSAYWRCFVVAFLMAGFYGGAIEGRKHDLDDAIAAFLVLFAAACVGASTGLQQEQEPPRTIADALQRADGCDSLVHHVPSAEKHLEETKEYQAKLDKRMHELFNEPQA